MKIAFDLGGVVSKYPEIFKNMIQLLCYLEREGFDCEVFVVSDIHPMDKIVDMLIRNHLSCIKHENVYSADYRTHGENCKAVLCEELGIDVLVDDFIGYVATPGKPPVRLLVMPDPSLSYFATSEKEDDPHWYTDGSEGEFGRRNPSGSKRPPEDR